MIARQTLLSLYRKLYLIRSSQQKIVELYPDGEMKCPTHLCIGQEAIPVGVCSNLNVDDYVVSFYRSHGHFLAKGGDLKKLFGELYGKETGALGGRGGSMLLSDPSCGVIASTALVAGGIPIAVGAALASKLKGDNRVAVSFFGDAAVEEGVFHESLNFASLKKLPVIFVCENNFYAVMSHWKNRKPADNIYEYAKSYNMPGIRVDGNDVLAVFEAAKAAVERARNGEGPTLLECRTYRLRGHIESFTESTDNRSEAEIKAAENNEPLLKFHDYLIGNNIGSNVLVSIENEINGKINEAVVFAKSSAFPNVQTLLDHVYPQNS